MTPEVRQKVRVAVGIITIIILVFLSYSATDYLRKGYDVNPVSYNRFDVVVLGDSITEGLGTTAGNDYVSLLREEYPWAKIRNSGVRSDTTSDALARIQEDVLDHDPYLTIVFLGGNDVLKWFPEEETFGNLKEIIRLLQAENIEVVLMGVPGGLRIDTFADDFESLVEETGVHFVPNILDGILGKSKHLKDPIHPNDAGHRIIFERLLPVIDPVMQKYY